MNTSYLERVSRALDAYTMRNEAISSNIANSNTPNYKRKYVKFEEYMNDARLNYDLKIKKTNSKHMDISGKISKPGIYTDNSVSSREDKNNVNIDVEEVDNVKNYINYSMLSDTMSGYFRSLITGITGGRK